MGKFGKWLKGFFGMKKDSMEDLNLTASDRRVKKRWNGETPVKTPASFQIPNTAWLKSYLAETEREQNKHAIAVAAATAAAADAAVAAARAAVAVVRLTSFGRGREKWAAVKIQTSFRRFLARKALRALKGLVKLQALFRGYLVRKQTAEMLHRIQSLIKTQNSVRLNRVRRSISKEQSFNQIPPRKSTEIFDSRRRSLFSESSDKIVEIDKLFKSKSRSRRFTTAISDSSEDSHYQILPTGFSTPNYRNFPEWSYAGDDSKTPRFRKSPVTPARSVCGEKDYSNYPSYMANTSSFKAKLRSFSAPKQRLAPEKKDGQK